MRRIFTAVILIPAVVLLVLWGPPPLLVFVEIAIAELGLWEFFRLAETTGFAPARIPGYLLGGVVGAISLAGSMERWLLGAIVLVMMILFAERMAAGTELHQACGAVSSTLLGLVYVAVPMNLLIWTCIQPGGRLAVLFLLLVVWTGDTMAYFIGRAWGTHKLSPRISPGKTWEGSAASLLFAALAGLLFHRFVWTGPTVPEVIILAVIINLAAQVGDLAESVLKRGAGVKDSSNLVPGHGGVLDRIDALLFAAPVLWYYWLWKTM